jgi:hypothetical protein
MLHDNDIKNPSCFIPSPSNKDGKEPDDPVDKQTKNWECVDDE